MVVSSEFEGKSLLDAHKLVNSALSDELRQIHALAIQAKKPQQWEAMGNVLQADASPACLGGMKREAARSGAGDGE